MMENETKIMLEEYRAAQASAEHNDHVGWLMSSIFVIAAISIRIYHKFMG